jgi:plastocyanin
MRRSRRPGRTLECLLLVALVACTKSNASGLPPITLGSDDPSTPYGITAIDYHFHDAHPSIPLSPNRTVLWTNAGSVRHNVTIPALGFSRDLPVGATIQIARLGEKLGGPGTYPFFCKYHDMRGMAGLIVIAGASTSPVSPSP